MTPSSEQIQSQGALIHPSASELVSGAQLRVLQAGVRFTPTSRFSDIRKDAEKITTDFIRAFAISKLAESWPNDPMKLIIPSFLKKKFDPFASGQWHSPEHALNRSIVKRLKVYLPFVLQKYLSRPLRRLGNNMSSEERTACAQMINDPNHLFVKADKDRVFVKVHTTSYFYHCLKDHLLSSSYKYVGHSDSHQTRDWQIKAITTGNRLFQRLPHTIPMKMRRALMDFAQPSVSKSYTIPGFRLLYKNHKTPMGTRPIAGASNWISTLASKWLSQYLLPLVRKIPVRLEDTPDLQRRLKKIQESCKTRFENPELYELMVGTADVTAMYPSIPLDEGRTALRWFLRQHGKPKDEIDFVVALASWILTTMLVQLGPYAFEQTVGTAMGTNFAPEYANIVMFYHEARALPLIFRDTSVFKPHDQVKFYLDPPRKKDDPPMTKRYGNLSITLIGYFRFIDDIFLVALKRKRIRFPKKSIYEERVKSITAGSALDLSAIEFGKSINFLDLTVTVPESNPLGFETSLYYKPSNTHLHLPPFSQHAPAVTKAIPLAGFRRIIARCSTPAIAEPYILNYLSTLAARGYPSQRILQALNIASKPLLKEDRQGRNFFSPIRFNSMTEGLSLRNTASLALFDNEQMREIVNNAGPSPAWTQASNLQSILKPRQEKLKKYALEHFPSLVLQDPAQLVARYDYEVSRGRIPTDAFPTSNVADMERYRGSSWLEPTVIDHRSIAARRPARESKAVTYPDHVPDWYFSGLDDSSDEDQDSSDSD